MLLGVYVSLNMQDYEKNPRSIKYHVRKYLESQSAWFSGKQVVDFPAGNGITSALLTSLGASVHAFDLFPEYFNVPGISCTRANIRTGIPLEAGSADALICQEGIEHFSDQFQALSEFNRVLKPNGRLIVTTPNYSNLRSKVSYLLAETERFGSMMPPNESDSVWMQASEITNEVYFGHVYLIGIQKLRVQARLAGFQIRKVRFVRAKSTSILLFPIVYPFILLNAIITRLKWKVKGKHPQTTETYKEQWKYMVHPGILVDSHLFIEFEKISETHEVLPSLVPVHKTFGTT